MEKKHGDRNRTGGHKGTFLTGLLPMVFSHPVFLYNPGTPALKWHHPYCDLGHVNISSRKHLRNFLPGQYAGGIFLIEFPSTQMNQVCVKLTKKLIITVGDISQG